VFRICRLQSAKGKPFGGEQDYQQNYQHFKPHTPPVPSTTVYGIAALPPQTPCPRYTITRASRTTAWLQSYHEIVV